MAHSGHGFGGQLDPNTFQPLPPDAPSQHNTLRLPGSQNLAGENLKPDVLKFVEPFRDLLHSVGSGIPQIIVLGVESSGKSTMLERLTNLPVFPQGLRLCTRMPVRLEMRYGPVTLPTLSVVAAGTSQVLVTEALSMIDACKRIQEKMQEIIQTNASQFQGRNICIDKELVIRYQAPTCADMDILDLPGLLAAKGFGDDPEFEKKAEALAKGYIRSARDRSMFLVLVEAAGKIATNLVMTLVNELRLEDRTIGILTKADEYGNSEVPLRNINTFGAPGFTDVDYGWTITSSKLPPNSSSLPPLERLAAMTEAESKLLAGVPQAGLAQAHESLKNAYSTFLAKSWGPKAIKSLIDFRSQLDVEVANLGIPYIERSSPQEVLEAVLDGVQRIVTDPNRLIQPLLHVQACLREILAPTFAEERRITEGTLAQAEAIEQGGIVSINLSIASLDACQRLAALLKKLDLTNIFDTCFQAFERGLRAVMDSDASPLKLSRFTDLIRELSGAARQMVERNFDKVQAGLEGLVRQLETPSEVFFVTQTNAMRLSSAHPVGYFTCQFAQILIENAFLPIIKSQPGSWVPRQVSVQDANSEVRKEKVATLRQLERAIRQLQEILDGDQIDGGADTQPQPIELVHPTASAPPQSSGFPPSGPPPVSLPNLGGASQENVPKFGAPQPFLPNAPPPSLSLPNLGGAPTYENVQPPGLPFLPTLFPTAGAVPTQSGVPSNDDPDARSRVLGAPPPPTSNTVNIDALISTAMNSPADPETLLRTCQALQQAFDDCKQNRTPMPELQRTQVDFLLRLCENPLVSHVAARILSRVSTDERTRVAARDVGACERLTNCLRRSDLGAEEVAHYLRCVVNLCIEPDARESFARANTCEAVHQILATTALSDATKDILTYGATAVFRLAMQEGNRARFIEAGTPSFLAKFANSPLPKLNVAVNEALSKF